MAARAPVSLRALAERWPIDGVRPRVQFRSQLLKIADAYEGRSDSAAAESSIARSVERLLSEAHSKKVRRRRPDALGWSLRRLRCKRSSFAALRLRRLSDTRLTLRQYPRSALMQNPPSAPNMYERLAEGLVKAERQAQASVR